MFQKSTDSVPIHYQIEGSASQPVLLMVHGFYGSLQDWYEYGYVDTLASQFRLVMVDVRGFGQSGKPLQPSAYTRQQRLEDLLCVLDAVECRKAFYYGFSMGGWIVYGLMDAAPERFSAYALAGSHPFPQKISQWKDNINALETWVPNLKISAEHKRRILQNDRSALIAACAEDRTDSSLLLQANPDPHLFIYGSNDPVKTELAKLMPFRGNNEFVELPGLDHMATLTRSDLVLPVLTTFLAKFA